MIIFKNITNKTLSSDMGWTQLDAARTQKKATTFGDENVANIRPIRASIGRHHLTQA